MNTLSKIAVSIIALSATPALANTQTWAGNSGTVGTNGCSFTNVGGNNRGLMERSEVAGEEHIWKTTRRGNITVFARGQASVGVTSNGKLYTEAGAEVSGITATVNYRGLTTVPTTAIQKRGAAVATITDTNLAVNNLAAVHGRSQINFIMGGTVTMTTTGELDGQSALDGLNNSTVYNVVHTATCTQ